MSIYKINNNLPTTQKISTLSDMILELEGLIKQAKFDKNELDQIYNDVSGLTRQFLRNQDLGHTLLTYTNWTNYHSETGYDIWKISPTTYSYNANNQFYLDDKIIENRGEATSEALTTFDCVYLYTTTYTDNTTEAGTEDGTEFSLMSATTNYLYIGSSSTFTGIDFEFQTRGANYTLVIEYYNDESGGDGWTTLTANLNTLEDNTSGFESNGNINWSALTDWALTTVNSQSKYWIRISTSTTPTTTAKAYLISPYNSVISLLSLSSSQILNEEWAWCSYGSAIYVTLRNSGNSAYEGDYYITSSSSDTNKKNYFIYNHCISGDYLNSTY